MIIVVLLFFQSLCLYLQKIVLTVHDKWLNPKHARLLIDEEERRLKLFALKPKHPVPGCNFCSNSPLGYCRHHNPNQPTLRHLKNRLIARASGAPSGKQSASNCAIGSGSECASVGRDSVGVQVGSGGSIKGSIGGGISQDANTSLPNLLSDSYASYILSKKRLNTQNACSCLSCSHSSSRNDAVKRRNRTSWATRSNPNNQDCSSLPGTDCTSMNRSCYDNETKIVTNTRRIRRYERLAKLAKQA